jgi:hypothetical protein
MTLWFFIFMEEGKLLIYVSVKLVQIYIWVYQISR